LWPAGNSQNKGTSQHNIQETRLSKRMSSLESIIYKCERCGTEQSLKELSRFPEIKCKNCGYRVLKKIGRPAPKKVEHAV